MKKIYISAILVCMASMMSLVVQAQYATTGVGKYRSQIFWLPWLKSTTGVGLTDAPTADFSSIGSTIVAGNYTWTLVPGKVRVQGTVSNVHSSGTVPGQTYDYVPIKSYDVAAGDYSNGFNNMYGGLTSAGLRAYGGLGQLDIALQLQIYNGSTWVNATAAGVVVADGESIANNEYIAATTTYSSSSSAPKGWELLDYNSNNENNNNYTINVKNNSTTSTFKATCSNDAKESAVMFARGATALTNVQLKGGGAQIFCFGFVIPFDYGDAPETYGSASNFLDGFGTANILSNGNLYPHNYTFPAVYTPNTSLWLGANKPDAEGSALFSSDATLDNTTGTNDEDGVDFSKADILGNRQITVPVVIGKTTSSATATLYGWIDFNKNGIFDDGEKKTLAITSGMASGSTQSLTFTAPADLTPGDKLMARFRITSTNISAAPATQQALNGETEDYQFTLPSDCDVKPNPTVATAYTADLSSVSNPGYAVDGNLNTAAGLANLVSLFDSGPSLTVTFPYTGSATDSASILTDGNGSLLGLFNGAYVTPSYVDPLNPANNWTGSEVNLHSSLISVLFIGGGKQWVSFAPGHVFNKLTIRYGSFVSASTYFNVYEVNRTQIAPTLLPATGTTLTTATKGSPYTYTGISATPTSTFSATGLPAGLSIDPTTGVISGTPTENGAAQTTGYPITVTATTHCTVTTHNYIIPVSWALPVTYGKELTATLSNGTVVLNWATAVEVNNKYFDVQRSTDQATWTSIGTVSSKITNGTGAGTDYDLTDYAPLAGTAYYRLVQYDLDGKSEPSRIVSIVTTGSALKVIPNPAIDKIKVAGIAVGSTLSIYSVSGQLVKSQVTTALPEVVNVQNLASGIYLIRITDKTGTVQTTKFIKQ